MFKKNVFSHYDYSLLIVMMILMAFGLIMVYSAGSVWASMIMKPPHAPDYFFVKQLIAIVCAMPLLLVTMLCPYRTYRKLFIKLLLPFSLGLLLLLFAVGSVFNHAQSWLIVGAAAFQPAELAKLTVIIYLASVFSNKQERLAHSLSVVFPPLIVVGLFVLLVYLQPDLGTALIVLAIAGVMTVCAGLQVKHMLTLAGAAAAFLVFLFSHGLSSVQAGRFTAAYDPFSVAGKTGSQLINSYIAIASGGLTGRGLGRSIEKTGFLPEPQNDFIIAIIGEELGLLGILFVVVLLAYLVFKGFVTAVRCNDQFGSLLAVGISAMIGIQSFVNLGAASGLLPVTGVTLPFISYGGSSIFILMMSMGVLLNISASVNRNRAVGKWEGERTDAK
ncbi:MAG: FtsW/RodA/SpoVE family cell cycle protein [Sporolactobacillus sp.]